MNAPVTLQTLELPLHAPLAAAVVQGAVLQHLKGSLTLPVGQHGSSVTTYQALAHDAEARAAL